MITITFRGEAGSGKTLALRHAFDTLTAQGLKVVTFDDPPRDEQTSLKHARHLRADIVLTTSYEKLRAEDLHYTVVNDGQAMPPAKWQPVKQALYAAIRHARKLIAGNRRAA